MRGCGRVYHPLLKRLVPALLGKSGEDARSTILLTSSSLVPSRRRVLQISPTEALNSILFLGLKQVAQTLAPISEHILFVTCMFA